MPSKRRTMIKIHVTEKGGFSCGEAVPRGESLKLSFGGIHIDSVILGGHMYPVKNGIAVVDMHEYLTGVVSVIARNSITRRTYPCDSIEIGDDEIVPLMRFTPKQYIEAMDEMAARVKKLEDTVERLNVAVFGAPLFIERKE
jgi:hypothetical protein